MSSILFTYDKYVEMLIIILFLIHVQNNNLCWNLINWRLYFPSLFEEDFYLFSFNLYRFVYMFLYIGLSIKLISTLLELNNLLHLRFQNVIVTDKSENELKSAVMVILQFWNILHDPKRFYSIYSSAEPITFFIDISRCLNGGNPLKLANLCEYYFLELLNIFCSKTKFKIVPIY